MSTYRPIVLCILDGWGHREETQDNAIAAANTPCWDRLCQEHPRALLRTSGDAVGLPHGQMGNSEVGHMNIGAGRVVQQDLPRIDAAIANGSLATIPAFASFVQKLKSSGGTCHLMGLLSDGGVHSHQDHILALAKALAAASIPVRVHAFLDGRDTPHDSAAGYIDAFEQAISSLPDVAIATVSGRYYAMDRDQRWDRVEKAYRAIALGEGETAATAAEAVDASYQNDVTDEFVLPCCLADYSGIGSDDGVLMANFRSDRAREILSALLDPDFAGFTRDTEISFAATLGMVSYSEQHDAFLDTLFPPLSLEHTLGQVIADHRLSQLRIAETEKYAHVTFFLNGGREDVFEGEERILVPSPKVATYDLKPEMSAVEVTDQLVDALSSDRFDLMIVNYANSDMVGHTGIFDAAVQAVETIDQCLARLVDAVAAQQGVLLITSDHGNIEHMRDAATGAPVTSHTTGPVPLVMVGPDQDYRLTDGRLCDIAPTILQLAGLPQPQEMSGSSLLV